MVEEGKKRIVVRAIVELMGMPKEHVEKTLADYVAKTKEDTTLKVLSAEIAQAEPVEGEKEMFSSFVEFEIEFSSTKRLLGFCIDSLPSSIDILEPEKMFVESAKFADLLNDILATLHNANKTLTMARANAKTIDDNAVRILENFVIFMSKRGVKTAKDMQPFIGMPEQNVNKFLEDMSSKGLIKKKGDEYTLG